MTAYATALPLYQFFDANGDPLVGGKLYSYAAGTTTPLATYTDSTGTIPNTNPIILDANGQCQIWLGTNAYKFNLTDASGVQQSGWPVDNIQNDTIAQQLSANLLDSSNVALGDALVAVKQPFTGAVSRTQHQKNAETISADDFGPYGQGDDTAALQAAINATPSGRTLTGNGLTYTVTSLFLPSNFSMEDFNFLTKPGANDYVSPITIDGRSALKTNIRLRNIHVNGQRHLQTAIGSQADPISGAGAGSEDGGRMGFRIIGQVTDLQMFDCSATLCAGWGMELFSGGFSLSDEPPSSANVYPNCLSFKDILIDNFTSTYNRGAGAAFDSLAGVTIRNCKFNFNGLDQNAIDPVTVGTRADREGNTLANPPFSSGIDVEGYGVGSGIDGFWATDCQMIGNARTGCLFLDRASPTLGTYAANFRTRKNIFIHNLETDFGVDASSDGSGIQFTPLGYPTNASNYLYQNVQITDLTCYGTVRLTSVDEFRVEGWAFKSASAINVLLDSSNGVAMVGGKPGNTGIYNSNSVVLNGKVEDPYGGTTSFSGTIAGTVLTVTALNTGKPLAVGMTISGAGVTAGTTITSVAALVGNNAPGSTYNLSASSTVAAAVGMAAVFTPTFAYTSGQAGTWVSGPTVTLFKDHLDGWVEYTVTGTYTPSASTTAYWAGTVTVPSGFTFKGFTAGSALQGATGAPLGLFMQDSVRQTYVNVPNVNAQTINFRFLIKKN